MTLFSSKAPLHEVIRWDGVVVETGLTLEEVGGVTTFWTGSHVRPLPQNNPTNPILAAFREYVVDPYDGGLAWCADIWLDAIDGWLDSSYDAYRLYLDIGATSDQIAHARAVLVRLAVQTR